MWPLALVDQLVAIRADLVKTLEAAASKEDTTTTTPAADPARATVKRLAEQLPASSGDVKAVCILEAKVAALLQSLLFDALKQTERTILRNYSKTTEELETDRARADGEFLESLEMVRRNSSNSLEGAMMSYAGAQQAIGGGGGGGVSGFFPTTKDAISAAAAAGAAAAANTGGSGGGDLADSLVNEKFVGEDGTAIPRWLIQLQQLEKSFVCEVCGGTVYQGPKVFREHFGQERHTEGLKRLGVLQNLREFEGVSTIRGAIEMRDRVGGVHSGFRKRLREDKEMEEMQDGQGNVITNKLYLSLQHRGRN